ncbi:hypothetical protein GA0070607_5095 [Micromonospora coriariae]|uniref:Uncharacterized protein n=1 Tax=Micromonospora coriariae TaxID=285665 RepID=A0A1C4XEC2_9ACTN|nr:hypothetical protein [Micromonospora coriariae]SCF06481.1 hypothetical protein GA0070607_5095 [Micromonospora coriariae]
MTTHTFRHDGRTYSVNAEAVRVALADLVREDLHEHWVEIDGARWPVKQVFGAVTGLHRSAFTSHTALRHLQALKLPTSLRTKGDVHARTNLSSVSSEVRPGLAAAFATLLAFLGSADLTGRISDLEARLNGVDRRAVSSLAEEAGMGSELLRAALLVRQHAGRLSDVIHAAAITLVLPKILEDGERVVRRPSLAAGNDLSRPYDLETDRRIAEFKVSVWKGADAMRKRGVFADLVHLALDTSGRRPQLYVAGPPAIHFLRGARGTAEWGLNRSSPRLRQGFEERFGPLDVPIRDFTAGPAGRVELIDLTVLLPEVAAAII